MPKPLRIAGDLLARPVRDVIQALDLTIAARTHPLARLALFIIAALATWLAYVPVHELLHVAGCRLTGGEVRQVTIAPLYGGRWISQWIPLVAAGGDYAGRVTEFSTGRSDLCYLVTDAAPYLLSIAGVPLLRAAVRRRRTALAGAATVLALAPFISLTGDYYEMGSVLATRAWAPLQAPPNPYEATAGVMALRSDDLIALIGRLIDSPEILLRGTPGGMPAIVATLIIAALTGLGLALLTYAAGHALAGRLGLPLEAPLEGAGSSRSG